MSQNDTKNFLVFTGTSHRELADEVATYLGAQLGKVSLFRFPDGEISLQILDNVRGRDVFVIQTIALDPNNYLMELLILIDALKRASAKSINVVVPYFGYGRQDRKDKPRVPITAKLVANLLEQSGVTRVLTMDLHAEQIQGFFDIPVDNLHGRAVLAEAFREKLTDSSIVVAPDAGSVKLTRDYAGDLGTDFAILDKLRVSPEVVKVVTVIGDVKDKDILLADDMCSTAGTLVSAAKACHEKGAKNIYAALTHGLFVGDAVDKIENSPIDTVYVSNSIPWTERLSKTSKIRYVSIAPLLGKAIQCVINNESISSLCNANNAS